MSALESRESAAAPAGWQRLAGGTPEPEGEWSAARRRWPMPEDERGLTAGQARTSRYEWTGPAAAPGSASDAGFLFGAIRVTARAVIGDDLRKPTLWCEFGSCISRFSHDSALGELDNHRRALAAGWRQDAFGRWLCPGCLDRHPYWNARPLQTPRR